MTRKSISYMFALGISLLFTLTGCMPQRVSMRAMVTAVELKEAEDGWIVTAEYRMRMADTEKQTYGLYQGEGRTYEEAMQDLESESESGLYLDSVNCLIVDSTIDRQALLKLLKDVNSDGRVRPATLLVLGGSILENKNSEEWSVGQQLSDILGENGRWEEMGYTVKDALNTLQTVGLGGAVPIAKLEEDKCRFGGAMLLGEQQLVSIDIDEMETLPFQIFAKQTPVLTLQCGAETCDIQLEQGSVKVNCDVKNGAPNFMVTVTLKGYYLNLPGSGNKLQQTADMARSALEEKVLKEFDYTIANIVQLKSADIFSFGKICSILKFNTWQAFEKNWPEYLENAEYKIVANVKIEDKRRLIV